MKPIATKKQLNLIPHRFKVDLPDDLIMAVVKAKDYIEAGYTWVVDIDLARYFDTVNHYKLMSLVARKVKDKSL